MQPRRHAVDHRRVVLDRLAAGDEEGVTRELDRFAVPLRVTADAADEPRLLGGDDLLDHDEQPVPARQLLARDGCDEAAVLG